MPPPFYCSAPTLYEVFRVFFHLLSFPFTVFCLFSSLLLLFAPGFFYFIGAILSHRLVNAVRRNYCELQRSFVHAELQLDYGERDRETERNNALNFPSNGTSLYSVVTGERRTKSWIAQSSDELKSDLFLANSIRTSLSRWFIKISQHLCIAHETF